MGASKSAKTTLMEALLNLPLLGSISSSSSSTSASLPGLGAAAPSEEAAAGATDDASKSKKRYLIGLTTSAGFGDQFKRVSTYAAMASELNRTLVMWPVFTSPHYRLEEEEEDSEGGRRGGGPLRFSDYVQITGDAVDAPDRVVAWSEAPAEAGTRDVHSLNPSQYSEYTNLIGRFCE